MQPCFLVITKAMITVLLHNKHDMSNTDYSNSILANLHDGIVQPLGDSQDTSRALYTSIHGLPKDWRRHPGRPRRTWLRTKDVKTVVYQNR